LKEEVEFFTNGAAGLGPVLALLMGLYHPLDGITNLEYTLLCFLTPKKIIFQEEGATF
jgi:hypothetical protein